MAYALPTLPDDKIRFYTERLFREVSNLFIWHGLPEEIPVDYLERTLVRHGRVMFFYDEEAYGYMALRANVEGYNIYEQPVNAFAVAPNTNQFPQNYNRTIVHKYDKNIGIDKACVLINNMYMGESLQGIVDHYAYRLALIQQAFDTNALWQNRPVLIPVDDDSLRLSLERLFGKIYSGEPWIIHDKSLLGKTEGLQAQPIEVEFLLDKLFDAKKEVYNEFLQTIGIKASPVDKKERLLVDEVNSNDQIIETCVEIMYKQRKIACEEINDVFGLNVTVDYIRAKGEVEEDGSSDDRIEARPTDGEF